MNLKITAVVASSILLFASLGLADSKESKDEESHPAGASLQRRVALLEEMVAHQSKQIDLLRKSLDAEVRARRQAQATILSNATSYADQRVAGEAAARQAADALLQNQLNNLPNSAFSPAQITALQNLTALVTTADSSIHIAGNLCIDGDVAIRDGHQLFVNRVMPNDGGCAGNPAGITVFGGNVGIEATNVLFVNTLRAFTPVRPSPQEFQQGGVFLGPGVAIANTGDSEDEGVYVLGPLFLRSR